MTRVPLPRSAGHRSWNGTGNAGLFYEKFGGTWTHDWSLKAANEQSPKLDWIRSLVYEGEKKQHKIGDENLLAEHAARQRKLAGAFGVTAGSLTNRSAFVTGLGISHPIENGFAWHPSLGVPYLPGSGLKGVLRNWLESGGPDLEAAGGLDPSPSGNPSAPGAPDEETITRLLGSPKPATAGALDFLPLLPTRPVSLSSDVVNPHHLGYRQGQEWPADWQDPVPSFFLSVATSNRWQFAVLPRPGRASPEDAERAMTWLVQAADWYGFGAKTAVGYGRFKRS